MGGVDESLRTLIDWSAVSRHKDGVTLTNAPPSLGGRPATPSSCGGKQKKKKTKGLPCLLWRGRIIVDNEIWASCRWTAVGGGIPWRARLHLRADPDACRQTTTWLIGCARLDPLSFVRATTTSSSSVTLWPLQRCQPARRTAVRSGFCTEPQADSPDKRERGRGRGTERRERPAPLRPFFSPKGRLPRIERRDRITGRKVRDECSCAQPRYYYY